VVDDLVAIDPRVPDPAVDGPGAVCAPVAPIPPVVGALAVALAAARPDLAVDELRAAADGGWLPDVDHRLAAVVATARRPAGRRRWSARPPPTRARRTAAPPTVARTGGAEHPDTTTDATDATDATDSDDVAIEARATWAAVGALPAGQSEAMVVAAVAGRDAAGVARVVHRPLAEVAHDLTDAWTALWTAWPTLSERQPDDDVGADEAGDGTCADARMRRAVTWAWSEARTPPPPPVPGGRPPARAVAAALVAIALLGAVLTARADDAPAPHASEPAPTEPADPVAALASAGWVRVEGFAGGQADAVVAGPDGLVAVGSAPGAPGDGLDAVVWTSDDGGRSWVTEQLGPSPGDQRLRGVAVDDQVTVAVGVDAGRDAIWRREDGGPWEQVLGAPVAGRGPRRFVSGGLLAVAVATSGFVAVGSGAGEAQVLVSVDGRMWERVATPDYGTIEDVVAGRTNGVLVRVATGGGSSTHWSEDGRSWRNAGRSRRAITWAGDRFVGAIVTADAEVVLEATFDARTWTELGRTTPEPIGRDPGHLVLGAGPGGHGYVLVSSVDGQHPGITVSLDGATWTPLAHDDDTFPPGSAVAAVAWTSDGPVLVGTAAWVPAEPDGTDVAPPTVSGVDDAPATWTRIGTVAPAGATVRAAATSGGRLVAVGEMARADEPDAPGDDGRAHAAAWWSDDGGVTWAAARIPDAEARLGPWTSVAAAPAQGGGDGWPARSTAFVAVAEGVAGGLWWSDDGTTWERSDDTRRTFAGADLGFAASIWGGGIVVGGSDADGAPAMWSMLDGVTWVRATIGNDGDGGESGRVRAATMGGNGLVAAGEVGGYGAIWTSQLGEHWMAERSDLPLPPFTAIGTTINPGWWGATLAVASGPAGDAQLWERQRDDLWARVDDPRRLGGATISDIEPWATGSDIEPWATGSVLALVRDGRPVVVEAQDLHDRAAGTWATSELEGGVGSVVLLSTADGLLAVGNGVWQREEPIADDTAPSTAPLAVDGWESGWHDVAAGPLTPRYDPAVVWAGTRLLVWGGWSRNEYFGPGTPLADGALWDPVSGAWTEVAPSPLDPRASVTAVWTGTEAILWGGGANLGSRVDGAAYDPATDTWTSIPDAPGPGIPSYRSPIVWTGVELVAIELGAAWDPAAQRWRELPDDPVGILSGDLVRAAWTGRDLVVVGTAVGVPGLEWVAAAYDPTTDAWHALPAPPLAQPPDGRTFDVASLPDGSVVLIAGNGSVTVLGPDRATWRDGLPLAAWDGGCSEATTAVAGRGAAPPTFAVALCDPALATLEADGSWLVHPGPDDGFGRLAATPFGLAAWGDGLAVWGRPLPGEPTLVVVSGAQVDLAAPQVAAAGIAVRRVADDVVEATFTSAGVACAVRRQFVPTLPDAALRAWVADAAASPQLVTPAAGGPSFSAWTATTEDGTTLEWGDDSAGAITSVTCTTPEVAATVATVVDPPRRPSAVVFPD
jgi:hypothetical protein